ncbi:unnamed protein product, partial [Symbiodinium pilosum]
MAFKLLVAAHAAAAIAVEEAPFLSEDCNVSLLQMQLHMGSELDKAPDFSATLARLMKATAEEPHAFEGCLDPDPCDLDWEQLRSQGACNKLEAETMQAPIRDVVAKHADEDGWCVFGALGAWTSACAVAHDLKNLTYFAEGFQSLYQLSLNLPIMTYSPVTLRLPGGQSLTIRDHAYPLDEMLDESDRDSKVLKEAMDSGKLAVDIDQATVDGMRLHGAAKCAMSNGQRPVCDVSNCAARGCLPADGSGVL